ncbi:protein-disulfide reductase DsbD family protein, partial [Alishewanella sp. SMS9]|nr:protein-disulfide reductase DsbD family protein [Alishewanella sp. SMS9]
TTGPIQWPTPQQFSIPPLMNYGFGGPTVLLSELTVPADYAATELNIAANVDWLVCEEICIPTSASFELTLAVAAQAIVSETAVDLINLGKVSQPNVLAVSGQYDIAGGSLSAAISGLPDIDFQHFFVRATEVVDHAAPQQLLVSEGEWILR